jgi:V8-like Glu-specific endopeptidase
MALIKQGREKIVMERRLIALSVTLLLSLISTGYASVKVIYGDDNRVDVYASKRSDYVQLSKATAAMIPTSKITRSILTGEYEIKGKTLQQRGMCAEERFSNQPTAANCSGFLVGGKYLVTAGHCIRSNDDCAKNMWVFNYKMLNATTANLKPEADDVYRCKKILTTKLDRGTKADYALIELDREVKGVRPLKFRRKGKVTEGTPLVVIGHPTGLPTKIADGANVRRVNNVFFNANLDTYGGNSGSAVINTNTGEVEGILVRGARDYITSSDGCRISNRYENNKGRGEDVTLITLVKELQDL